nr:MAG TPA: hypothetical protein [Caudoviricetes sp.]
MQSRLNKAYALAHPRRGEGAPHRPPLKRSRAWRSGALLLVGGCGSCGGRLSWRVCRWLLWMPERWRGGPRWWCAALLQPLDDGAEVQPCAYIIKVKRKNNDKSKNNCKNIW